MDGGIFSHALNLINALKLDKEPYKAGGGFEISQRTAELIKYSFQKYCSLKFLKIVDLRWSPVGFGLYWDFKVRVH